MSKEVLKEADVCDRPQQFSPRRNSQRRCYCLTAELNTQYTDLPGDFADLSWCDRALEIAGALRGRLPKLNRQNQAVFIRL
jgi:hypothetical protein